MEQHSLLLSDLGQQIGEVKLVLMEEVKTIEERLEKLELALEEI